MKENKELLLRVLVMLIVTFSNVIDNRRCLGSGLNLALVVLKKMIIYSKDKEQLKGFQSSVEIYQQFFNQLILKIKVNS